MDSIIGTKVQYTGRGVYDSQRARFEKAAGDTQILTIRDFEISEWKTTYWFEEIGGGHDSAMFEPLHTMSPKSWDENLRGPKMSDVSGKTIFKYQMPVLEKFEMELPIDAEILRVQDVDGMFWLWAVVNTNSDTEIRKFRAFKTGAPIPEALKLDYIGFCAIHVQMELGLYIFEEIK